jgi:hypothetical protein
LIERGPEGLAGRVDRRLAASGRALQRDGKKIADPTERLALVTQACDTFSETTLLQLERLGVVART